MAFSGLAFNEHFAASTVQEDVAAAVAALAPKEVPILDFLGDGSGFATQPKHEYTQDHLLPNFITNSGAISSAVANTGFQINATGLALNVGTILENESAAPELMQVVSIAGANSILVSRNYGGVVGSLAAGGSLYVRESLGVEGADHSGGDTRKLGDRLANTVGLFRMELAQSGTEFNINAYGNDGWDARRGKGLIDVLHQLEKAVVRGVLNTGNSLATATTTRSMQGLRGRITTVNSALTTGSLAADPHLYIGNVWEQMWINGASDSEEWGIIAGRTVAKGINDLNDSFIRVEQSDAGFTRQVRVYRGTFGDATVHMSRVLGAEELLIIPRDRVKVVPLQGRSFDIQEMAKSGDNQKALIVGEYTLETHHESGMGRLYV